MDITPKEKRGEITSSKGERGKDGGGEKKNKNWFINTKLHGGIQRDTKFDGRNRRTGEGGGPHRSFSC